MYHELIVTLSREPLQLDGDAQRLSQALQNLLNNAAKYTESGGRVTVTAERDGERAVVSVSDNGRGIEARHLPAVFEMFSQISPVHDRSDGGLGIGLALVRSIVELHGGSVEARSRGAGLGSQFVLHLPVRAAADRGRTNPSTPAVERIPSRRVLVADDNPDSAESLAMLLRHMGHAVDTAHDGIEALDAVVATRHDLCLLDIGMPRLDGYEVASRIRSHPWGSAVRLVALTGWGQEGDRQRSLNAGFNEHVVKPLTPETLQRLLASAAVSLQQRDDPAAS